ncbi:hypothetical protein PR048_013291 [Dryococelus australis]|uniref:Uncharacterized protein n=1 Tax=Dryococelus australis TaxID=614101 RepID=A0ABQ9HSK9_9NEOP|nr:hypothetical protein PR048_013291 [Dryococelus australis]
MWTMSRYQQWSLLLRNLCSPLSCVQLALEPLRPAVDTKHGELLSFNSGAIIVGPSKYGKTNLLNKFFNNNEEMMHLDECDNNSVIFDEVKTKTLIATKQTYSRVQKQVLRDNKLFSCQDDTHLMHWRASEGGPRMRSVRCWSNAFRAPIDFLSPQTWLSWRPAVELPSENEPPVGRAANHLSFSARTRTPLIGHLLSKSNFAWSRLILHALGVAPCNRDVRLNAQALKRTAMTTIDTASDKRANLHERDQRKQSKIRSVMAARSILLSVKRVSDEKVQEQTDLLRYFQRFCNKAPFSLSSSKAGEVLREGNLRKRLRGGGSMARTPPVPSEYSCFLQCLHSSSKSFFGLTGKPARPACARRKARSCSWWRRSIYLSDAQKAFPLCVSPSRADTVVQACILVSRRHESGAGNICRRYSSLCCFISLKPTSRAKEICWKSAKTANPLYLLGMKIMQGDMHRGKEGLGSHGLHFGTMATSLSVLRASLNYEEQGKNFQERQVREISDSRVRDQRIRSQGLVTPSQTGDWDQFIDLLRRSQLDVRLGDPGIVEGREDPPFEACDVRRRVNCYIVQTFSCAHGSILTVLSRQL